MKKEGDFSKLQFEITYRVSEQYAYFQSFSSILKEFKLADNFLSNYV